MNYGYYLPGASYAGPPCTCHQHAYPVSYSYVPSQSIITSVPSYRDPNRVVVVAPPLVANFSGVAAPMAATGLSVAGNASVMFMDGMGEAKRAAKALQRPVTSNTRNEASGGRYVSTDGFGDQSFVPTQAVGAHDSACRSCGHTQHADQASTSQHPYAPHTFQGTHHVPSATLHSQPTDIHRKQLADDTMQMLGYTVEGVRGTGGLSPIRGQANTSAFANSTAGYVPQNYMAPSDVGGAANAEGEGARSGRKAPRKAAEPLSEEAEVIRDRIQEALGGRDPTNLRSILALIENKGQLSDAERAKVFDAASSAAAASSTLAASSDIRSKYANIVHKAEEISGVAMPNAGSVFARIGQHVNNAYEAAEAKRSAAQEQAKPRASSRGKAAGHTYRATVRASGFGSLPTSTVTIAPRSSSVTNHRAAGRHNPLQLGSAGPLGCRGLAGAKGNSSLALGSCAVERNGQTLKGKAIRGPSPTKPVHGQGRARSADAPGDNIRSLHYRDGIVDGSARPSGVRAVAPPIGAKKG